MRILSVETSCDDTGVSIIEAKEKSPVFRVLSNIISSQVEIHKKWGGVYPILAKREHQRNLVPILEKALKKARLLNSKSTLRGVINHSKLKNEKVQCKIQNLNKILEKEPKLLEKLIVFLKKYQKPEVEVIAVTIGPGLGPCLWVGVNFARALAFSWNLPIIPVNHIEAHIFANFVGSKIKKPTVHTQQKSKITFPAISLVASGGHTQLILMKDIGSYQILGETRDDAAGECFDKVAKILGLGYPGGPAIEKKAKEKLKLNQNEIKLPRPMIYQKNYDFSFSGLKTAVLYLSKKLTINNKQLTTTTKREICRETQQAIIDVLLRKTQRAVQDYRAKTVILGGGVTANKELRKQFKKFFSKEKIKLYVPKIEFSTDNAAMVAVAAHFHFKELRNWKEILANANLRIGDEI